MKFKYLPGFLLYEITQIVCRLAVTDKTRNSSACICFHSMHHPPSPPPKLPFSLSQIKSITFRHRLEACDTEVEKNSKRSLLMRV